MASPARRVLDPTVPARAVPREEITARAPRGDHAALLMSLVQVTGEESHLLDFGPRLRLDASAGGLVPRGTLPGEDAARLAETLADALETPGRRPYLQVPGDDLFRRMVSLACGTGVDAEFVPLIKEQAGFVPPVPEPGEAPPGDFRVAVLGAGMSGIAAAIALADAGFDHEVFEAADDIGGTWRANTYPGIAVDTPSLYYSYSFAPEPGWSRLFPTGAEYRRYLHRVVDEYGLRPRIRFGTTITSLTWDEPAREWVIGTRGPDGEESEHRANAVITAAGFLNRPRFPDLPGRESFAGASMHTARWDHSVDLRGKRVGVIGAGATSVQVVDAIFEDVGSLTLFQRQPHWVMPNFVGEGLVGDDERWLQAHVPFYDRWQRARTYWFVSDVNYPSVRVDPAWTGDERSISEANDRYMRLCLGHLEASFGHDPGLMAAMTPDFPVHGKRIVRDPGGFYTALTDPRSEVVTAALEEVTPEGIRTADGRLIELDVIVYATGFTLDFLSTVDITGRDGVRLADRWAENDPRSYLGGTVPGFPNLFVTSGPNSSSGHGGGHNFMTEAVVHYILACLHLVTANGAAAIEVTESAQEKFVAEVDERMEGSVWRHSWNAHTYYRNAKGRVVLPNPWRMVDYWAMLRSPEPSAFVLTGGEEA